MVSQLARGQMRLTDLARDYPVALNTVSKHVRVLEEAGIIQRKVDGRNHILSLNARRIAAIRRWINQTSNEWSSKLVALEAHLERKRAKNKKGSANA